MSIDNLVLQISPDDLTDEKAAMIADYIHSPTQVPRNVKFIMNMAQACQTLILHNSPLMEGLLPNAYDFNQAGICFIHERNPKAFGLEMQLYGNSAHIAEIIENKTGDEEWNRKWVNNAIRHAEISQKIRVNGYAYNFSKAAFAAKKMFHKKKNEYWGKLWYDLEFRAAAASEEKDKTYSARTYRFAAIAARNMYDLTNHLIWAQRCAELNLKSADVIRAKNLTESTYAELWAADALYAIYSKTHDTDIGRQSFQLFQKCLEFYGRKEGKYSTQTAWAKSQITKLQATLF
jgi:hypothetical protein